MAAPDGSGTSGKFGSFNGEFLDSIPVIFLQLLELFQRLAMDFELFFVDSFSRGECLMMQIHDAPQLFSVLLKHYLFCIGKCQPRGHSITLNPNFSCTFKLFQFLNRCTLSLQDVIVCGAHNVQNGSGESLSQLGSENRFRLGKLCLVSGFNTRPERVETIITNDSA